MSSVLAATGRSRPLNLCYAMGGFTESEPSQSKAHRSLPRSSPAQPCGAVSVVLPSLWRKPRRVNGNVLCCFFLNCPSASIQLYRRTYRGGGACTSSAQSEVERSPCGFWPVTVFNTTAPWTPARPMQRELDDAYQQDSILHTCSILYT